MKPTPTSRLHRELDAVTPQWPVVLATLADPPTVTVSGITTPITGGDPQHEVVRLAAAQARSNNRPIRARVTTPGGEVHRLIITPTGRVAQLDDSVSTDGATARKVSLTKKSKPPGRPRESAGGESAGRIRGRVAPVLTRFPRPVRWAGLALGMLTAVALIVLVVHDRTPSAAADPGPGPVPPPGRLYTQLAPPGWSQQAGWVLPIADGTIPATDPATGVTAAVTPEDRSSTQTAGQPAGAKDGWLSVLEPDGRTRWAAPLDGTPTFGPVITRVDGTTVALIGTGKQIRYWPLTGSPRTDVDLPSGARLTAAVGGSVLLTLPGDRVGYLHSGSVRTVQVLPRTKAAIAVDGGVLVVQADTGAWWTLTDDAAPTSVTPTAPTGAGPVQAVLAVTATRVLIAWNPTTPTENAAEAKPKDPKTPATLIVAGYDRATGELITTASTPTAALAGAAGKSPVVVGNDTLGLTAAGPLILSTPPDGPAVLTVVPGFTATSAADHVYGTLAGTAAVIGADGTPQPLPDGTLTPNSGAGGEFLPVVSQGRLYALQPGNRP